jgi:hypothetical protein
VTGDILKGTASFTPDTCDVHVPTGFAVPDPQSVKAHTAAILSNLYLTITFPFKSGLK